MGRDSLAGKEKQREEMICYEIKKLGKKKIFCAFVFLLVLGNLLTIYLYNKNTPDYYYVHEKMENYRRFLNGEQEADLDGFYQADWEQQENYLAQYPVFLGGMEERAADMQSVSIYSGENSFVYRNLEKTCRDFAVLSGITVSPGNSFGIRQIAAYNIGILYVLCFLMILMWFVFFYERNQGMFLLVKGTKRGHFPLAFGKLGAVMLCTAGYTCLQEGSAVLFFGWLYGYGDLGRSIQSVSWFRNCPYPLTVGQALGLLVLLRVLAAEVLALILYVIGAGIRNELTAVVTACIIYGVQFLTEKIFSISGSLNIVKCVNPFYCWNMRQSMGEYLNLNLFGNAVGKDNLAFVAGFIVVIICGALGMVWFHSACQVRSASRLERFGLWLRGKTGFLWRHTSLFWFEAAKMLIQQKKGLVVVLLFIWCANGVSGIRAQQYYDNPAEATYHSYIKQVSGKVTEQSIDFVREEQENIERLYLQLEQTADSTSGMNYILHMEAEIELRMKEEAVELLAGQLAGLQGKEGELYDKYWIDEIAYLDFMNDAGNDLVQFMVGCAALILLTGGVYPVDEKKKILSLLASTRNGRKFLNSRKDLCCLAGALVVFLLAEYPVFLRYQCIDGFTTSTHKMCDLTMVEVDSGLTIGIFLVAVFVLKLALFLLAAFGTVFLSRIVKNEMVTVIAAGGVVAAAVLLCYYFQMDVTLFLFRFIC